MPFDAGSISSSIGIDVNPFTRGMLQATTIAHAFPEVVTAFLANPLLGFLAVAEKTASGFGGAIQSVIGTVESVARGTRDLANQAAQAGVSVEFLSRMGAAFEASGSSVDGLADSLKFLNRNMADVLNDARLGETGAKQQADAFRQLGISTQFLSGHLNDTQSVLLAVADGLKAIPTRAEQTDVAIALLGKSGADSINALSKGREGLAAYADDMDRLGATVTTQTAAQGRSFAELMDLANEAVEGIKLALTQPILSALQQQFGDAKLGIFAVSDAIRKDVGDAMAGIIKYLQDHGPEIKADISEISTAIYNLLPSINAVTNGAKSALAEVQAFADLIGATDPNKRFGNPYAHDNGLANGQKLTGEELAKSGTAALQQFQAVAAGYQSAAKVALNALNSIRSGQTEVVIGAFDRDTVGSVKGQAGKIADALQPQLAAAAAAQKQLDALQQAMAAGVKIDPHAFDGPLAAITTFTNRLGEARELLNKIQGYEGETGILSPGNVEGFNAVRTSIEGINAALSQAQGNKAALAEAFRAMSSPPNAPAHHADGGFALPREFTPPTGLGDLFKVFTPAADNAGQTLVQLHAAMKPLPDLFGAVGDQLATLSPALVKATNAINSATSPGNGSNPSPAAPGVKSGGITVNANIPPFDANAASSQVAAKLQPIVRSAVDQQARQFHAAAMSAAVQGGL